MRAVFLCVSFLALAACAPEQITDSLQDLVECQALATEQGLIVGADERNVFMTSCLAGAATDDIIRNLILDDDALGGGGKL